MAVTSLAQISITTFPSSKLVVSHKSSFIVPFPHDNISSPSSLLKKINHNHSLRVSPDGLNIPSELTTQEFDSKFVPLNAEDPNYGPPALLLLGFQLEEEEKIQQLLKDLDGEFLRVIFCTRDMIASSLWDAVNSAEQSLDKIEIANSVPRVCFMSGLTGEEMMMFIDAFQESGMEPAVFAALVPNSADKSLLELIEEIMADHEMTKNAQQ